MFSNNDQISLRQAQILFILSMFASVSLTLPRYVAELGKESGWMLVIGGFVILAGYCYLICTLGKMFPNDTIVDYSRKILTKPIGTLVSLLIIAEFMAYTSIQLRLFGELVKQTLLPRTPIEIIMIVMLFSVTYLARKGFECRGRFGEVIVFFVFVPILLIMVFAIKNIRISNLAPFVISPKTLISGSLLVSLLISGPELLFVTIPFIRKPDKVTRVIMEGLLFVGVILLILTVVTIGIFDDKTTASQIWPVMTIMQVVDIPGAFVDRQDALMMVFWIMLVYTMLSAYVFNTSILVSKVVKTGESYYWNLLVIPIIYIFSLIPNNVPEAFSAFDFVSKYMCLPIYSLIPLILLIIAKLRKLGVKNESKSS